MSTAQSSAGIKPTARRQLSLIAGAAGILLGVVLPIIGLVVLGWLWLWERGLALTWVFSTLGLTAVGLLVSFLAVKRLEKSSAPISPAAADSAGEDSMPVYSPREAAAWQAVEQLAATVEPSELKSREAVLSLGIRTIEAVARQIHPDKPDAIWRFTVPEALTLVERVSGRLKPLIAENIPLGDQLSVGQVMHVYRWRSALDLAHRAYDLWRIVRLMNPIAAATQELRERMSKAIYSSVQDELAKRLAAAYVHEVGRAAIDLYGGRLRVDDAAIGAHVSTASREDLAALIVPAEPLRILVGGQTGAGKSSLINALAGEVRVAVDVLASTDGFVPVQISREGLPEMIFIDAVAPGEGKADLVVLAEKAGTADLIVWVSGANRADRNLDKAALTAIESHFAARPDRRPAPRLLVVSHIDLLRPARDWHPPYDLTDEKNVKAHSIATATEQISSDLGFDVGAAVPVCLAPELGPYNVDVVWARIASLLPEAKRAQLVRVMAETREGGIRWRRVLGQAAGAGRLLAGALKNELLKR